MESGAQPHKESERIQQAKRAIARLIDVYGEGLLEKNEFEPRIRCAKERLSTLQKEASVQTDQANQEQELRLVIGCLQEFADQVRAGLQTADWETRSEILRAMIRRVEVDENQIRIVYRVNPPPFAKAPEGGVWQDCLRLGGRRGGQPRLRPGLNASTLPRFQQLRSGDSKRGWPSGIPPAPLIPGQVGSSI
jgi:site-specific DNA recombinase